LVTKITHEGRNEEKKQRDKVEKKRRLILLSYYPQTEKQGTFEKGENHF